MNPWSAASWQQIQRDIFAATNRKLSFDTIELAIDDRGLWDATPEEIVAKCIEESDL